MRFFSGTRKILICLFFKLKRTPFFGKWSDPLQELLFSLRRKNAARTNLKKFLKAAIEPKLELQLRQLDFFCGKSNLMESAAMFNTLLLDEIC